MNQSAHIAITGANVGCSSRAVGTRAHRVIKRLVMEPGYQNLFLLTNIWSMIKPRCFPGAANQLLMTISFIISCCIELNKNYLLKYSPTSPRVSLGAGETQNLHPKMVFELISPRPHVYSYNLEKKRGIGPEVSRVATCSTFFLKSVHSTGGRGEPTPFPNGNLIRISLFDVPARLLFWWGN